MQDRGKHNGGAYHRPLPDLLNALADAGLAAARLAEAGEPTPVVLAVAAVKGGPPD